MTAKRRDRRAADFDTGIGNYPDGAYGGKADEGNAAWRYWDTNTAKWIYVEPYFSTHAYDPPRAIVGPASSNGAAERRMASSDSCTFPRRA